MKNKQLQYPIKFTPILKEKVWGGKKLSKLFNKTNGSDKIGESWELSAVSGDESVVSNGELKGKSLPTLVKTFKEALLGKHVYKKYGTNFPLLFKFIDASDDLSVQLHPDDILAQKRHKSFGKTEMWYILHTENESKLVLGFKKDVGKREYEKNLDAGTIKSIIQYEKVKEGDSFFIAPGTVHAIGKGIVLAEIQQTSDITYRIFDWDRMDLDGKPRELHTSLAVEAINFNPKDPRIHYKNRLNNPVTLHSNAYFHTSKLILTQTYKRAIKPLDSFVVYMCIKGEAIISTDEFLEKIKTGETVLIPASVDNLQIKTTDATFLEVYIP